MRELGPGVKKPFAPAPPDAACPEGAVEGPWVVDVDATSGRTEPEPEPCRVGVEMYADEAPAVGVHQSFDIVGVCCRSSREKEKG